MIDTEKTRTELETIRPNSNEQKLQITGILLACDILDELRQNAANRKAALENWKKE